MACTIASIAKNVEEWSPLAVWRVQGGVLNAIPKASYGTFMSGDSYVILSAQRTSSGLKRKVYIWQGTTSSVDERGGSAILAKELDDALGGSPEQVRMVQGEEPEEFKQLFPDGLNFRKGGVASSFKSVTSVKIPPKFFIVKSPAPGKAPLVTEVVPAASSLVSNASFLLDDDSNNTLYVWHGISAGLKEKRTALDTANTFRFSRGQLRLTVMDQYDTESADAAAFFAALGAPDVASAAAAITTCEGAVPAGAAVNGATAANGGATGAGASMYRVDESAVDATPIKPPSRSALDATKQYLVVAGGRGWLWVGSKAGAPHLQTAQRYATSAGLGGNVEVVKDRLEPGLFMTHFPDWGKAEYAAFEAYQASRAQAAGYGSPGLTSPTAAPVDWAGLASKMVADSAAVCKTAGPATTLVSQAPVPGKVTVSVIVGHEFVEVTGAEVGHFFAGDAYMVLHEFKTSTGEDRQVINFWQGRHATNIEQGSAALLATDLHNTRFKGTSSLVRVAQQTEPASLVSLFGGRMVVHKGERPAGGLPNGGADIHGPRLYQVKIQGSFAQHAVEVDLTATSLNSGDCFIVKDAAGAVVLWYGAGSSAAEAQLAATVAGQLSSNVTTVKEGEEPANFWIALGGRTDYPRSVAQTGNTRPPVYFRIRDAGRAGITVDASTVFSQEDLDSLDLSILEAGDMLCVWCGRETAPSERVHAHKLVDAYIQAIGRKMNIVDVEEGAEPPFFTQHFAGWDATKRVNMVDLAKMRLKAASNSP